ncbi:tail fiber protein [Pectobacterium odoriferum]|uniref:phage tail fiber protein n=1 Tax=Pectobacterium odoriferum TaxID=78398 RepID=UPI0021562B20|nr:phage tail protein [Pectobacterium odoriferum]
MANLSENPQWVDGIYQIETSDPVVGGPDGVSNRQAKELASRTRYLKKEQEKTGSDLATHAAAADPHTQYAPKDNPTFTGTPKAPTPATDSNSQQVATTAFVKSVAAALVNGAPAALDTLQELAKSLGNDPNFSATVLNELAKKLSLSGGTLTGEVLSSAANALRLIYGDYGVIMRNDGNRFYLLLTNKGDKTGNYNTLRPFDINLATGDMTVGHDLNVTGLLKEKGQRVYSPNNKPTAVDVGAYTKAETDASVGVAIDYADTAVVYATQAITNANSRVPSGRAVNGKALSEDITLSAGDVGAYTKAETDTRIATATTAANNAATAATSANTNANGRVPSGRKVNDKALTADIALTAVDVGALPTNGTAVAATKLATPRKINGVAFDGSVDITLTPANLGLGEAAKRGVGTAATNVPDISTADSRYMIKEAGVNYVRQGVTGVISKGEDLAWNKPTGAYLKTNEGDSSLIWHIGLNTGSASAAQFHFNYANGGLRYRSSRDGFGFEKSWARIYTDQDKPTAAEIGALPVSGTAVAAVKLATPRKINGVVFDGTADINIASRWNKVASGSVSYPLVNSQTKSFVGTIDTGVVTTSWVHDSKKYAVVLSSKGVEVRTSNPANCSWGASGELRSITRFNGNSTILIDVFTYGQNLQSGAISTWELWEIVS